MEILTLVNGNGNQYELALPKLVILTDEINDVALKHIEENTGLKFVKDALFSGFYKAQPETALQIAALFLTYNFKSRYYNNWDLKNTLLLKFDHHVGFDVDSICYECCEYNHIPTSGLPKDVRLSC
jgi:hypothetical protein